jgi:hypothetical protein
MATDFKELKEKIAQFILKRESSHEEISDIESSDKESTDKESTDTEFNELALKLFAFQYEHNIAFRKYCRKRRVSPSTIQHYTQIPAVPIAAFKEAILSCCPIEEAEAVFMTSGTTDPSKRGKNVHCDLEIYDLSMASHFKPFILPDVDKMRMAILFPTEKELPNSSLAHYLHLAKQTFGTENSEYVVSQEGFDIPKLLDMLRQAEQTEEPILVIGATFSFVHFLEYCQREGVQFKLPIGSRIMDTGGAKGKSREIQPLELRKELSQLFTVAEELCVNMYGMTELSSQFYDLGIYHFYHSFHVSQENVSFGVLEEFVEENIEGASKEENQPLKKAPHWVRTHVIDPITMKDKPIGEKGIIIHYDLANVHSVLSIMTEDLGISEDDGFQLLGRATGAEAKGCSLVAEQFISSAQQADLQND